MTKKFFAGMMMAASALFITSCASDDMTSSQAGGEATVSFSLALEDGLDTRAISDGSGADVLMYAVFDEAGERITGIEKVEKKGVTFPTVENITLAKGQTYQIAFWAQDEDCAAYTVSDDMNVTIDYAGVNNDETRDAFFKSIEFTVSGPASLDVVLKRPFAQINVGVYQEDWGAAVASGIEIGQSVAYIKNAATSINLLNGQVGEETTDVAVEYTAGAIPTETLMADADKDGTKEAYKWLSMSYILVADHGTTPDAEGMYGAAATTLDDLGFSFIPNSGNTLDFKQGLRSVPVERNWRTNIIGKILTGDIEFNISIDPIYENDYIYPDGIAQQLEFAATFGGTVTLNNDVTIDKTLIVQPGVSMVINLNGNTITNSSTSEELEEGDGIIVYGNLILDNNGEEDGGVTANTRAVWARANYGAHVTIKGGKYVGSQGEGSEVIYASGDGVIDIYGGEFEAVNECDGFAVPQHAVLNLHGNGATGCDINVYGGKYKNFNPSDNISENPKKDFVEAGYVAVADGEYYNVIPGAAASDATGFQAALDDTSISTIVVDEAIDNGSNMFTATGHEMVINMNNNEIKAGGNGTPNYGFNFVRSDVEVNDANILGGGFAVQDGSSLVFNSGKVKANYSKSGRNLFFVTGNSEVVVNDGVFEITRTSCYFAYADAGCKVTINGGTFTKAKANSASKDVPFNPLTGGVVEVKGGKFNVDPTNWLAAGYKAVKSGSYWEVSAE